MTEELLAAADILERQFRVEARWSLAIRGAATVADRSRLYLQAYDELYRDFPHLQSDPEHRRLKAEKHAAFLRRFTDSDTRFLEIGPGRGDLSLRMARHCRSVDAIDATANGFSVSIPENLTFQVGDGSALPFADGAFDLAFSDQLLEHLHPDDARLHLQEVCRVLRPGGRYLCLTPNRLNGPHDVSRFFESEPSGLHLREYSRGDLRKVFLESGFSDVRLYASILRTRVRVPSLVPAAIETMLSRLPRRAQQRAGRSLPIRPILGAAVAGIK
jgi:SAM-dependent methyltransferase